jgi:hypothetical protein
LGVAKSVCFYRPKKVNQDEKLKDQILSVLQSNPAYGHRRIALALGVGKKRIRRVMKLNGIKPYKKKADGEKGETREDPRLVFQT